jgi:hypothetical protein
MEQKREVILDLSIERPTISGGGYAHVRLRPMYRENGALRSFVGGYANDQTDQLADLSSPAKSTDAAETKATRGRSSTNRTASTSEGRARW